MVSECCEPEKPTHMASYLLQPTHSPFSYSRDKVSAPRSFGFFEVWVLFHLKGIMSPLTQHNPILTTPWT